MAVTPHAKKARDGGGTGADPMAFPHDWHRGVLSDFLDAIEQDREPRIDAQPPRWAGCTSRARLVFLSFLCGALADPLQTKEAATRTQTSMGFASIFS